jgi:hypothetical protein
MPVAAKACRMLFLMSGPVPACASTAMRLCKRLIMFDQNRVVRQGPESCVINLSMTSWLLWAVAGLTGSLCVAAVAIVSF